MFPSVIDASPDKTFKYQKSIAHPEYLYAFAWKPACGFYCQTQNPWNMNAKLLKTWIMVLGFAPFFLTAQEAAAPQPNEANPETEESIPIDEMTEEQRTQAIFNAVSSGDTEGVKPLLSCLTYYKHNKDGETALTKAIKQQDHAMVALLTEDAVINLKNQSGETPLTLAIKQGNLPIIQLVMRRAKAGLKNDAGEAPLFLAIELEDLYLLQELISRGADVNRKSNGITPLARATLQGQIQAVALLIRNGADPSIPNDNGDLPLYLATSNGQAVIAGILLHKSPQAVKDANWTTKIGQPLIVIATEQGFDQIVKTLLDFGADPNQFDHLENTPLNIAAEQGRYALSNLLVQSGADPNHANIMGTTPIAAAAKNGHNEVANLLAEQGANPNTRNYEGIAATDYGSYLNNRELDAVINAFDQTQGADNP
jgi:ankyrin repeat protein